MTGFDEDELQQAINLSLNMPDNPKSLFDKDGIHSETHSIFDSNGYTKNGIHKRCHIPGPRDFLARKNLRDIKNFPKGNVKIGQYELNFSEMGIYSVESFLEAVERKCQEFYHEVRKEKNEHISKTRANIQKKVFSLYGNGRVRGQYFDLHSIDRDNLLLHYYSSLESYNLYSPVRLSFLDESGIDAGGLRKEYFNMLNEELKNTGALKKLDNNMWTINKEFEDNYFIQQYYLPGDQYKYYQKLGLIFAKVILVENDYIDFYLSNYMRQRILGNSVNSLIDLLAIAMLDDELTFQSAMTILNMDNPKFMYLDFHGLLPQEINTDMDNNNVFLYIWLDLKKKIKDAIEPQMVKFLEGYNSLIGGGLDINGRELDLLFRGPSNVTLNDLKDLVIYSGNAGNKGFIRNFWTAVEDLSAEKTDRNVVADLLKFWTASNVLLLGLKIPRL